MVRQTSFGRLLIKKYLLGFSLVIIFSLFAFTAVSSRMAEEQTLFFCKDILGLHLKLLEHKLLQIQEGQRMMAEDADIREIIAYHMEKEDVDYVQELRYNRAVLAKFELLFRDNEIERAYIVDKSGKALYAYKTTLGEEGVGGEPWFWETLAKIEISTSYISGRHESSYLLNAGAKPCISMLMPINQGKGGAFFSPGAYLICDLDPSKLLEASNSQIALGLQYGSESWLFPENERFDTLLIAEARQKIESSMSKEQEEPFYAERFSLGTGGKVLVLSMKAKSFGIRLVGLRSLEEEGRLRRNFLMISALTLGFAILLSILVSKSISEKLSRPIRSLMEKCGEVSKGDYTVRFDKANIWEFEVLGNAIRNMLRNIMELNEQMVQEEKRASTQKLEALQHQINPHFINNVLQTIKALALEKKTADIAEITTYLGKIMAYSVYRPHEDVSLEEELEHLENYLHVQNIRFNQKIIFDVECEPNLRKLRIPKLTLQPLVENAVEHGRGAEEYLMIAIHAQTEEGEVCILIHDNGKGIKERKLQEIKEKLEGGKADMQEKSIGILNVHERLSKKFGKPYGLSIRSREQRGTSIVVHLPLPG